MLSKPKHLLKTKAEGLESLTLVFIKPFVLPMVKHGTDRTCSAHLLRAPASASQPVQRSPPHECNQTSRLQMQPARNAPARASHPVQRSVPRECNQTDHMQTILANATSPRTCKQSAHRAAHAGEHLSSGSLVSLQSVLQHARQPTIGVFRRLSLAHAIPCVNINVIIVNTLSF
jgi:hypothetical protein